MKLSICSLTYNHELFIRDTIESFLAQDISDEYEIIISDDASTDNTQNILQEYKEKYPNIIKPIFNQKNIGPSKNFKQLLSAASGEYIAYCDGDDYWLSSDKIKLQINALEENPICSFSFHDVNIVSENGTFLQKHSKGRNNEKFKNGIINNRAIVGAPLLVAHANSLVFKKKLLDMTYLNHLGEVSGLDYALLVMLCSHGNGYYFNLPMSTYRVNSRSVSNSRCFSNEVLNEIKMANKKINTYYNRVFEKEINKNLKGHIINKLLSEINHAIFSKKYIYASLLFIKILTKRQNSQYSVRDIFWLLRNKIKT